MQPTNSISNTASSTPPIFNLAAMALILVMTGLGIAYWLNTFTLNNVKPAVSKFSAPLVTKVLLDTKMQIPDSWLNSLTRNNLENVEAVDLTLYVKLSPQAQPAPINIRLTSLNQAQPGSYLLDNVYALRFSPQQISGYKGLIGKPLLAEDGYENETVWYEPVATNPFVAKCITLETANTTLNCLRTIQLGSQLALTYQFSQNQLQYWRNIDDVVLPLMEQIGILVK